MERKSIFHTSVDLLNGPILQSLLIFAVPLFISNIFQQLYNTVDTMIVGNYLGDTSLAAIGSCSAIYDLFVGFALGIGNGLAIVTARSYGSGNQELLKKSVLAFDGFTGFTPAQLKTLRELAGLVKSMYVTVTIDANERYTGAIQEHELFALSKKTIQALLRTVYGKMEVEEPVILGKEKLPRFREGGELEFLERHLFRSGEAGRSRKDSGAGQSRESEISLHVSANPAGEVAFAARTIRGLVTEKGLRYREIAIITGDLSSYGHYVKKIFPRYEIPVFLDETRRILLNPGLELIRGALEAARKNLSYETMFRYLRTGMAGVTPEETDVLENYVLARGIRGWKRWNEPWTKEDAEREEPWEISRKKAMEKYRSFGERVRGGKGTVRKFAEAVLGLLEDCEVQQKLKDMETLFRKEGKLEQAREYSQVYPVIVELLDEQEQPVSENTPGEVTITTLGVKGMPLLRFKTGDICCFTSEPCRCGRNTPRLSSLLGRKKQMIKYKGTTLYPPALFNILNEISGIQNYIIDVSTNELDTDSITLRIASPRQDEAFIKEIKDLFRSRIRVAPEIIFESSEKISSLQFPPMSRKPIFFRDLRKPIEILK